MSRLEEIKENVVVHTAFLTGEAISFELDPKDYFYLKKQAERAEELEKENEKLKRKLKASRESVVPLSEEKDEFEYKNNCYKQALEEIIKAKEDYGDGAYVSIVDEIAQEALNQSK